MSRVRTVIVWYLAVLATGATAVLAFLTAYGDPARPVEAGAQAILLWLAPAASATFLLSTLRGRPLWIALVLVPVAVAAVWVGWGSHLGFRADVAKLGWNHVYDDTGPVGLTEDVGPAGITQGITTFYSSVFGLLAGLVAAALAIGWGGWYPLLWWAGTVPWVFLWALLGGLGQQFGEFPHAPLGPPPSGVGWGAVGAVPVLALMGWGHATKTRLVWPAVGFAATSVAFGYGLIRVPDVLLRLLAVAGVLWVVGLYIGYRRWQWERMKREVGEGIRR